MINGGGGVWGQVAYHDEPAPVTHLYLYADKIQAVFLMGLHRKVRLLYIECFHDFAVSSGRVEGHHLIPIKFPCVDDAGDICLLNQPQVSYGLSHTIEVRLQAAIVSILDFVRSEPDHFPFFGLLLHLCTPPVGRSVVLNIPYKWCGFSLSLSLSLPHVRPPALPLLSLILGPGCLQRLMSVTHRPLPSSHL